MQAESSYALQSFAADDREALRLMGIKLDKDGSFREMGYKGKQNLRLEMEEKRKRDADPEGYGKIVAERGITGPMQVADPFARKQVMKEVSDRSKLSLVTSNTLAMEGIQLDHNGKAILPESSDGLLHTQNPQKVLQKHQPENEEDVFWMRAYKNNPTILDYSVDAEEEKFKQMGAVGAHCPRCGKKICGCGYMATKRGRSSDGEDLSPDGPAKKGKLGW